MENKKKTMILSVVAIVTFAILIIGATYAYFQAQTGASKSTDVKVTTYTTDVFTFTTGNAINIALTQSDFASGKGNAVGNTFTKATLTANNKTNTATEHYYVYLNISNNTFTYSKNESTPELMLTVIGPDGNEVTNIEGLTHTSVTDGKNQVITGFDVTTKDGVIAIANNREITASPSKQEQYTIKLTFVNYNANQNGNAGKSMSAKVMIQKEPIVTTLASYITNLYTGTQGENDIYYHDASLTTGANDNSYRYAGASDQVNNYVCFGSTESPCPADNLYRIIGVFDRQVKLIKATEATSTLLGTDGAYVSDTDYKWSNLTACPSNTTAYIHDSNVIRLANKNIIGIPPNPDELGCNEWEYSTLNTVNLNTNYLNKIGTTWSNLIEDTTWKVSGHSTWNVTPKAMYTAEITNATKTYGPENGTSKIGLMYASDYGYAASPSAWTTNLSGYDGAAIKSVNWMYMGLDEWTIAPHSSYSFNVFNLGHNGNLYTSNAYSGNGACPVLYLKASVAYAGGYGTKDSPITLVV